MVAYFNELSLPHLPLDTNVIDAFNNFGEYYLVARSCGIREIKIDNNFFNHQFAPGYSFYQWMEDKRADEDLRTLLKGVLGSLPFVEDIFETYEQQHGVALEFKYKGAPCVGLGLASDIIFNSFAFSFTSANWNLPSYTISVTAVAESNDGEVSSMELSGNTKNIASLGHVATHRQFIFDGVKATIQSGRELWSNRANLFPNLNFCNSVEAQIRYMDAQTPHFQHIIDRLFDLQNIASLFTGNPIKPDDFPTRTTPESESRRKALKQELTFIDPNGNPRFCEWHSRYSPGPGRIHFFPFENDQIILVGYIGPKIQ